jgi:hypothetical protein
VFPEIPEEFWQKVNGGSKRQRAKRREVQKGLKCADDLCVIFVQILCCFVKFNGNKINRYLLYA